MKKFIGPIIGVIGLLAVVVIVVGAFYFPQVNSQLYSAENNIETTENSAQAISSTTTIQLPPPFKVTHVETPAQVKALYMSSWVAGSKKIRDNLINIIDTTELNSVVIDIKDYTGKISYISDNPELVAIGSMENRIPDVKEFIASLHEKNIYVIGRISVFQDSYYVHEKPEYAVKNKAGDIWKDVKGVMWLDAGARPVWDYIVTIGNDAYAQGFDELNFDYIRFPSDGNMIDIAYPYSEGKVKSVALKEFFAHIDQEFRSKNIPISADLFGMTTSNYDDLGIGQILEYALEHFDYVAPMVYPSHYPKTFMGIAKPATEPYQVIKYAMSSGVERAKAASTTPLKLRPWIQDFSIGGVVYTPEMVRAQIQATYDVGLDSWMLWNASNRYTVEALVPDDLSTATTSVSY